MRKFSFCNAFENTTHFEHSDEGMTSSKSQIEKKKHFG